MTLEVQISDSWRMNLNSTDIRKSPTKRKKYENGKDMEKVSYASHSTTDLKSNVLPEDSSLALRIDRKNE